MQANLSTRGRYDRANASRVIKGEEFGSLLTLGAVRAT